MRPSFKTTEHLSRYLFRRLEIPPGSAHPMRLGPPGGGLKLRTVNRTMNQDRQVITEPLPFEFNAIEIKTDDGRVVRCQPAEVLAALVLSADMLTTTHVRVCHRFFSRLHLSQSLTADQRRSS